MIEAKDEDDSAEAEAAKRKKTPEVAAAARESRGSLLLRAAVGAVETDGADAEEAEKVIILISKIIRLIFLHASFSVPRFSRAGSSRCEAPWRAARSRGSPRPTRPAAASATAAGRTIA